MLTTFQIRTWLRQLSGIKHSKRISEWTKWNEVKELTPMWGDWMRAWGKLLWVDRLTWPENLPQNEARFSISKSFQICEIAGYKR